jgi:hypothetical protein
MTLFDGFPGRQLELAAVFLFSRERLPLLSRPGRRPSPPSPARGSHHCHDALQPLHRRWRPVVRPPTGDPLLRAIAAAACSLVRAMPLQCRGRGLRPAHAHSELLFFKFLLI